MGEWSEIEEWFLEYLTIFSPVFPEQFDASHYEKIGEGLFQALEDAKSEEAERLFERFSDSFYTYTVESLQIQVKGERIESITFIYSKRRAISIYHYTETYSFQDFGSVTIQMPEPTEDPAQTVYSEELISNTSC